MFEAQLANDCKLLALVLPADSISDQISKKRRQNLKVISMWLWADSKWWLDRLLVSHGRLLVLLVDDERTVRGGAQQSVIKTIHQRLDLTNGRCK